MSEFNLNTLIMEVINESSSPDPKIIAEEVANRIPSGQCRIVLAQLLPDAVRERIRSHRNTKNKETKETKKSKSNRSTKWDKIRETASSPFTWRVAVPPNNVWKFLGDCTGYECHQIAESYFVKAAAHTTTGNQYLRLANKLNENQLVSSLSENEFWSIWND